MDNLTPAMRQFMEIKNKYKDCIVFFRMGDFYETFYDDAKITSRVLDIALTKRGIKNSEQSIPLAGIPYHAIDSYLPKMIKSGHKVAIVEQLEDPRFAKGVVKRDVVRIVTPGTFIDNNMGRNNNFICSLSQGNAECGIAFIDVTTGEFFTTETESFEEAVSEINRYLPSEIILPMSFENDKIKKRLCDTGAYVNFVSDVFFYADNARDVLLNHLSVLSLDGFGLSNKELSVSSSGSLISYLLDTQKSSLKHLSSLKFYSNKDFLIMDHATIKNLELLKNMRDSTEKDTLFGVLDKTATPMGTRLLRKFLLKPLIDISKINERLSSVDELINKNFILEELRELMKNISDIERVISRINLGNCNPRDLVLLQGSLEIVPDLKYLLDETESLLLSRVSQMPELKNTAKLIDDAIRDDPPAIIDEGNFIREGYNEELDNLREISFNAKKIIREIEEKERNSTGIKSLKIKYNKVFGYYIDITKPNIELAPEYYIRKQTLVNSERFITPELKELEEKILTAEERITKLEQELFFDIVERIKIDTAKVQKVADDIGLLDVLCNFATISMKNNYSMPHLTEGFRLVLKKSRHPVIEQICDFVPNDVTINEDNRVMIITGPNMAGKSCFMRQVLLNVIMAQAGCFVACDKSEISIVDKIFCRTGASDDISQGHSTFMVEMAETSMILNNATEKSLVVLDEIGRGTSTFDGIAIAWSVAEYLATKTKAKTLFATHYHVLNDLEKHVLGVKNYNIAVQEHDEKIIFLRKILEGGTDKSYGIHVAKLAGMPREVVERSKEIQFKLEKDDEISEKIIVETRKAVHRDVLRNDVEEVDRLIKTKQMTLEDLE